MKREKEKLSKGAASGMVALVFLVLGFQLAIFVVKVVERPPRAEPVGEGIAGQAIAGQSIAGQSIAGQAMAESGGGDARLAPGGGSSRLAPGGGGSRVELGRGDARSESEASGRPSAVSEGVLAKEAMAEKTMKTKLGGYGRPGGLTRTGGGTTKTGGGTGRGGVAARGDAAKRAGRRYESFVFDPNTVSVDELQRLGLSGRQAEVIDNYRSKGGRFRSKADFQKMYVVSDTLFARLEPFIEIPRLELNSADSAGLVALRGIGPYYARKILEYRERLGGFVDAAQLLEVDGIDADRFAGFSEDVTVDGKKIRRLDLWHASDSLLARHPYLGAKGARSVVRYRQLYDSARWTLRDLAQERVLPPENIEKLKKYIEIQ